MGIHFLCCAHGNEHIGTHDAICNTFAPITWDDGFNMGQEQLHALLSTTFNSFCQWVNIVLTKNDILTLVDVGIVDPLVWMDLLSQSYTTQVFTTFDVVQAKEKSYCN
jgi:hypothetical protein